MPNSHGTAVASYYANAYVGQFSSGQALSIRTQTSDSLERPRFLILLHVREG